MEDLIIWKLSLLYSLSRVVHRVVQRNNLLSSSVSKTCVKTQSVSKDKVPHQEMDLFRDAQEKTAMDSLQSARTHINFLTVNFP